MSICPTLLFRDKKGRKIMQKINLEGKSKKNVFTSFFHATSSFLKEVDGLKASEVVAILGYLIVTYCDYAKRDPEIFCDSIKTVVTAIQND